jgi:hypothetical protein
MKYPVLVISLLLVSVNTIFCQVKYNGIVRLTAQQSKKSIDGLWNSADRTGNLAVDKALDKIAAANKDNPKGMKALEGAAAQIKTDPPKYINTDGSINKQALEQLLKEKFTSAGVVTIPSVTVGEPGDSLR